jgi:hypothetical protein
MLADSQPLPIGMCRSESHGLWRSLVSALDWGSRGREFKSPQPDCRSPVQRPDFRDAQSSARATGHRLVTRTEQVSDGVGRLRVPRRHGRRVDVESDPGRRVAETVGDDLDRHACHEGWGRGRAVAACAAPSRIRSNAFGRSLSSMARPMASQRRLLLPRVVEVARGGRLVTLRERGRDDDDRQHRGGAGAGGYATRGEAPLRKAVPACP